MGCGAEDEPPPEQPAIASAKARIQHRKDGSAHPDTLVRAPQLDAVGELATYPPFGFVLVRVCDAVSIRKRGWSFNSPFGCHVEGPGTRVGKRPPIEIPRDCHETHGKTPASSSGCVSAGLGHVPDANQWPESRVSFDGAVPRIVASMFHAATLCPCIRRCRQYQRFSSRLRSSSPALSGSSFA
jgi:hypothetical protein